MRCNITENGKGNQSLTVKKVVLVVQAPWQRKGLCILRGAGDRCIWRYRTQTLRVFVLGDAAGIQEWGSVLMICWGVSNSAAFGPT